MYRPRGLLAALLAGVALVACSDPGKALSAPAEPALQPTMPPAPPPPGAHLELQPLTDADLAGAALVGGRACRFARGEAVLLQVQGDASTGPSQGVVKVAGAVERVTAPGGFDAMAKGGTFRGQGVVVRVVLTGGGSKPSARPATLAYDSAGGSAPTVAGTWTCGR